MKTLIVLATLLLILFTASSYADDTPKIVIDGMEAFKTTGYGGAFDKWLKGSPLESDVTTTMTLRGNFTQAETLYGKMTGYEILHTTKISSATSRVYAEVRYEKGPLFIYFDCYKSSGGWIIPMMKFNSDASVILPKNVLSKE